MPEDKSVILSAAKDPSQVQALPETIAVIGAGPVGRALARRAALAGFQVVLEDLVPGSLDEARRQLRHEFDELATCGELTIPEADGAYERIRFACSIEDAARGVQDGYAAEDAAPARGARQARIVMETGPDEYESKLEMFCLLDRICLPDTVIVSNCHQLELSDTAARADSIVGMYFTGDQAEIHCSAFTGKHALEVARQLAGRLATGFRVTGEGQAAKA